MKLITILILSYFLMGCQTASVAVDKAQDIRGGIAKKEIEVHVNGFCSANFNELYERFGKTDKEWDAVFTLCGLRKK